MKTTILALTLIAIAAPISAKTIAGCEVVQVEGANYFNKADPSCVFNTPRGTIRVAGLDGILGTADDQDVSDN